MKTTSKKFFWIKLKQDFFNDPYIKLLRRMAGGDTYTIIYLEMLVKSANADGMLYFQGAGQDIAEELALTLDENVEDVRALLAYLEAKKLITHPEIKEDVFLVASADLTGSETDSAIRVRKFRERQALHSNGRALQSNTHVTNGNDKLEIEKELEIDTDVQKEVQPKVEHASSLENDFDKLWKLYPRKQGKKVAFNAYKRAIKKGTTNKEIQTGIVNYKKELAYQERPKDKIKLGSTWFKGNCWEDDYETGNVEQSNDYKTNEIARLENELQDDKLDPIERNFMSKKLAELKGSA